MAFVLADRVKQTSTTAGTGTFTLSGAVAGFQTFAVVGDGNTTFYCIAGQTTSDWEVGIGTYTSSGTTLARTTVLSNSAATQPSALDFTAGTKDVFVTYPASRSVYTTGTGSTANTANGVMYANSTGVITTGSALTFDGTNFATTGSATATRFIPSGSTVATNGMYLPAADTLGFSTASTERMRIDSAGQVGIGASPVAGATLSVRKNITGGATTYGVLSFAAIQSDVTNTASMFVTLPSTAATTFTLGSLNHYYANQSTIGAGSTVTNQDGFSAVTSLTGATNNYGFYGAIASGTGRYNLYMAGTAANYFGGQIQLNQDYIEKPYSANSSTAITLDLTNGTVQIITLTGTATITMPTAVSGKSFIMFLKTGSGGYSVTWSTVKWPGGTAPTITSTASRQDIYSFFSDGTNWYGTTVGQNYTP